MRAARALTVGSPEVQVLLGQGRLETTAIYSQVVSCFRSFLLGRLG